MRILIILLFVSFNSFGQTYEDVMSIKDIDSFKKVCIENNYEYMSDVSNTKTILYESIDGNKGATYDIYSDSMFAFIFQKEIGGDSGIEIPYDIEYDKIYNRVKESCQFSRIADTNGVNKACYKCNDSKFNGEVCFVVMGGMGAIHFTKHTN